MFAIIGILIVILAVAGGYLMEKGHLLVLMQPAELLIIGGAAIGTMLIANPVRILKAIVAGMGVADVSENGFNLGWDNVTFRLGADLSVRLPSGPG